MGSMEWGRELLCSRWSDERGGGNKKRPMRAGRIGRGDYSRQ